MYYDLPNGIKGDDDIGISFISLEYKYENYNSLSLSINQRDFLDKLISHKRVKIGVQMFDEQFTVNSTDKFIAQRIFSDERIQSLFLKNRLLTFNIQSEKNVTTVKFKSMAIKLYTFNEMQSLTDDFRFILEKILM